MPNLHPFLVHFPIALLTVSTMFDLASVLRKKDELARVGWWTMVTGVCGLVASVVSGLLARDSTTVVDAASDVLEAHEQLALVVTAIFCALLLWRLGVRTMLPSRSRLLYLTLSLLALVLMWMGALYGGRMVYEFGVSVSPR